MASSSWANRRFALEVVTSPCVVTRPWLHPSSLPPPSSSARDAYYALINPANRALCGTTRLSYFPRGGPVPRPPPKSLSTATWGGLDAGPGMLYPTQAVDGMVHQIGGRELLDELKAAAPLLREGTGRDDGDDGDGGQPARLCEGGAVLTAGCGKLEFDLIAHTVPPFWSGGEEEEEKEERIDDEVVVGDEGGAAAGAGWEETVQRCYRTSIELLLDRCAAMPGGGGGRGDGSSGSSGGGGVGSGGCGDSSGRGSGGGDDGGGGLTLDSELWIASPLIGCGARGAPMDRAASAAAKALCELLLLEEAPTPPTTGASLTTAGTKTGPRTERMTRFRFVVQEQSHHDLLKQAIDRCLADADVIRH